jgi:probable rRNA maturation factor
MENSLLSITVENGVGCKIDKTALTNLLEKIYHGESVDKSRSCDLILCSEPTIQHLNSVYRNKDSVTDVLSYPFDDDDFLGEIYICAARALTQSKEYNFTFQEEVERLLVHGIFHLLGYDHLSDDEREEMESYEKKYFNLENL